MNNQLKDLFEKQKEASAGSKQEYNEEILQFIGFIIGDEE
ncbi:chemotaxis protein CheW, partial [Helicobacter pylori]